MPTSSYSAYDMPDGLPLRISGSNLLIALGDLNWEPTEPLRDPDLWTYFAKPNPDRSMVMKLARKHGLLYSCGYEGQDISDPVPHVLRGAFTPELEYYYCEAYMDWKREMRTLYVARSIFFGLREGRSSEAHEAIAQIQDLYLIESIYSDVIKNFETYPINSEDAIQELGKSSRVFDLEEDDLIHILESLIESRLGEASATISRNAISKTFSLRFSPANLKAAIWQQFAGAITTNKNLERCPVCRNIYTRGNLNSGVAPA
ncbi:hypothetical protein [Deinococcus carri]